MPFKKKTKKTNLSTPTPDKAPNAAAAMSTSTASFYPTQPAAVSRSPSPPTSLSSRSPSPQIIEDRYIDDDKLLELCSKMFPSGSYRLSYKFNRWYLDAPEWLDKRIIELCEIDLRI